MSREPPVRGSRSLQPLPQAVSVSLSLALARPAPAAAQSDSSDGQMVPCDHRRPAAVSAVAPPVMSLHSQNSAAAPVVIETHELETISLCLSSRAHDSLSINTFHVEVTGHMPLRGFHFHARGLAFGDLGLRSVRV